MTRVRSGVIGRILSELSAPVKADYVGVRQAPRRRQPRRRRLEVKGFPWDSLTGVKEISRRVGDKQGSLPRPEPARPAPRRGRQSNYTPGGLRRSF